MTNIKKTALWAAGAFATLTLISTVVAQQQRAVDANILKNAGTAKDAEPGTWLTYGLTQTEQRYSQLKQIDATNVGKLGLAWSAPLTAPGGRGGTEGTPLMWNNTIYQSMDNSIVYAIDARTGAQKWMYDAKTDPITARHMCCGTHNRGLAISDGKLILAANDARLIALDALTGKELWQSKIAEISEYYSLTIAPRIAGDNVVVGIAGGEYFIRGFFAAYSLKDGKLAWKFYTVPPAPGKPFEDKAQEEAAKTWTGDWAKYGGGGSVWDGLVYDPELNLIIAGTGNPEPWPVELRGLSQENWLKYPNLYTNSIVAVDAKTGKYKWHYQTVPSDGWDLDGIGGFIMADVQIEGKTRKVVMQAPKSGVFYIVDRTNGQFISAEPFVPINWATGFDKKNNGKPIINPDAFYDQNKVVVIYPGGGGAHNWAPMSFNPNAGLVYLPYSAGTYNFVAAAEPNPNAGGGAHGLGQAGNKAKMTPMPIWGPTQEQVGRGGLQARDPKTNTIKWVKTGRGGATGGGTMTTASNLVFQVVANQNTLYAYKADSGDELLALPFNLGGGAPPITYTVDGTQYIGFATGTQFLAMKVGGTAKMPDPPPAPAFGKGKGAPKGAPAPPPPPPPEALHGNDKQ
ncbi:MAG: PQQ-dependent dehydrogenase, methanol/ethanol family [Bryobacteraceae bacterium]